MVGNNGIGKTHLACSIANKLIENGTPVIYGTLINLLAELRNSYDTDNNISEMEIIKLYEKVDLLIIDDLGKEKPSEWALEKLFTIINSRYENDKLLVSKEGIKWLCKNCFKQKYLELLEEYKMELTEKYIEAGYVYDKFFGMN